MWYYVESGRFSSSMTSRAQTHRYKKHHTIAVPTTPAYSSSINKNTLLSMWQLNASFVKYPAWCISYGIVAFRCKESDYLSRASVGYSYRVSPQGTWRVFFPSHFRINSEGRHIIWIRVPSGNYTPNTPVLRQSSFTKTPSTRKRPLPHHPHPYPTTSPHPQCMGNKQSQRRMREKEEKKAYRGATRLNRKGQ